MYPQSIRKKIEEIIKNGEEAQPSRFLETVLKGLSLLYGGIVGLRILLYRCGLFTTYKLPCVVISVGNLTVGGVGKTPLVIYIVDLLRGLGYNVAALSRGYKGKMYKTGGVVSDGERLCMDPVAAGDEPYLIAEKIKNVPVLVGKNRFKMGKTACRQFSSEVLVLDDGFQHVQLERDIDLLLLDGTNPFGNGYCIPRGPLREPVAARKRADAVVLTRSEREDGPAPHAFRKRIDAGITPTFYCSHVPDRLFLAGTGNVLEFDALVGKRLFAFSGIARNDSFRKMITDLGGALEGYLEFPDHHPYSEADLRLIWKKAGNLGVDNLITTEKDSVRIGSEWLEAPNLLVLGIAIFFGSDKEAFDAYVTDRVSKLTGSG